MVSQLVQLGRDGLLDSVLANNSANTALPLLTGIRINL